MNGYIATGLFIGFMSVLYLLLISRFGVLARRVRAWEKYRERLQRDCSQNGRSQDEGPARPPASNRLNHVRSRPLEIPRG